MGTFLTGFLTGVAKGANERIEKEREDEEALITSRLKTAYVNKTKREEEARTKRENARARRDEVDVLFPAASLEQRLALVASPLIFEQAKKSAGSVDLNELLVINKDKIPKNLTSVNDFIASIQGRPVGTAAATEMQSREVFGVNVTPSKGRIESLASPYGGSAADLLAYETVSDSIEVPQFASLNLDALKKNKTSKERLEEANAAATQAVIEFGEETPQAKAAMDNYNKIKTLDELLNPTQAKWATYVSGLKLAMATGTPEQKAAAEAEFKREVVRIEAMSAKQKAEDLPAMSTLGNMIARTQLAAMRQKYGNKLDQNLRVTYAEDGSASFEYIGTDLAMQEEIRQHGLNAAASIAELYLDKDGRPLSRDMKAVLISQGYKFDSEGRMIKRAAPPAATTPAAPAAPPAATTPAAPAAPPAAPAAPPAATTPAPPAATTPAAPAPEPAPAPAPPAKPVIPDMKDIDEDVPAGASDALLFFLKGDHNEAYRQWSKTPDAPESLYGIGRILYEGLSGPADQVKGQQLLKEAAEAGSAEARMYLERQKDSEAMAWVAANPTDPRSAAIKKKIERNRGIK